MDADPEVPDEPTAIEGFPVLGDQTDVASVALGSRSGAVAVAASPLFGPEQLPQLAWSLEGTGVRLLVDPGMAKMSGRTQIRPVDGLPLQLIAEPRLSGIRAFAKTTLDLVVALLALVVLSPLLVIIMLTIVIADGGPILDRREYIGRGGKLFSSWTFRCTPYGSKARQTIPSASAGGLAVLTVATTKVGRVLMRTGLDEVPRLLTVLTRQMSIVGPRPVAAGAAVPRRTLVRPGITGPWRAPLLREDTAELDYYYIENWSIIGDLKIIAQTLAQVVTGKATR